MATILEFRAERIARQARRTQRLPLAGEIVVFPGVRYEYNAPAAEASSKSRRKGARRRDKIEIK